MEAKLMDGKKLRKRILAVSLALMLSVGLTPAAAFAGNAKVGSQVTGEAELALEAPQATDTLDLSSVDENFTALIEGDKYSKAFITANTQQALDLNKTYQLNVAADQEKFFSFKLAKPGLVTLKHSGVQTPYHHLAFVAWLPKQGYAYNVNSGIEYNHPPITPYLSYYLEAGTYFYKVDTWWDKSASFSLRVNYKASKETYKEPVLGNNNSIRTADKAKFKTTYYGVLGTSYLKFHADNYDYYKFSLGYATEISIKTSASASIKTTLVKIIDRNGKSYGLTKLGSTLTKTLAKGTYYLQFGSSYPEGGAYAFKMSYGPNSKLKAGKSAAKLSWSKVGGVSGYKIYRSTNSGSWKLLKTVSAKYGSYTDRGLSQYSTYYYKVRGFKGKAYTNFSATWKVSWR